MKTLTILLLAAGFLVFSPAPLAETTGVGTTDGTGGISSEGEQAITVGQFVVQLVDSLDAQGRGASDVRQARQFLSHRGIALPGDLDFSAPLTEGHVATIASKIGMVVDTTSPQKRFDADSAKALLGFLREEAEKGRPLVTSEPETLSASDEALGGGACCKAGVCTIETRLQCQGSGGLFRGGMTSCVPDPCVAGAGTCCIAPNVCVIRTSAACGGFFQGTQTCKRKTCRLFDITDPESPTEP